MKKQLTVGILAHVDAGKTTLSESILYETGKIRKLGRVDHKDAFLDTYELEKSRGITIFSKQARFELEEAAVTLLDTPGHVDFSAETERVLWALDAAVLVISGSEGVQSHTQTLWKLLSEHAIPTFLFINKMDMEGTDRDKILADLNKNLGSGFVVFNNEGEESFFEEAALCSEELCNAYLENGTISDEEISEAIESRKMFPCYFGSALKLQGVEEFLKGIEKYTTYNGENPEFGARIFIFTSPTAYSESGTASITFMVSSSTIAFIIRSYTLVVGTSLSSSTGIITLCTSKEVRTTSAPPIWSA